MKDATSEGRKRREVPERRKARRRSMPYVRGGVLELDGRQHIVVVSDLGPDGAYLATRLDVEPDKPLRLKMVLPRDGREVVLPCRVVRRNDRAANADRPRGIAVRFEGLEAGVLRQVEEFAMDGFLPSTQTTPHAHFEYRILDRPKLDGEELNRLGLDGWVLAAALNSGKGVELVLLRRR